MNVVHLYRNYNRFNFFNKKFKFLEMSNKKAVANINYTLKFKL